MSNKDEDAPGVTINETSEPAVTGVTLSTIYTLQVKNAGRLGGISTRMDNVEKSIGRLYDHQTAMKEQLDEHGTALKDTNNTIKALQDTCGRRGEYCSDRMDDIENGVASAKEDTGVTNINELRRQEKERQQAIHAERRSKIFKWVVGTLLALGGLVTAIVSVFSKK